MLNQNEFVTYLAEIIYMSIDEIYGGTISENTEKKSEGYLKLRNIVTHTVYGFVSDKYLNIELRDAELLIKDFSLFQPVKNLKEHLNHVINYIESGDRKIL